MPYEPSPQQRVINSLEARVKELETERKILIDALSEAVVICAKWSPGGVEHLTKLIGG